MARQYSAKTFLRNVPNALLKEYFDRRGVDLGFKWDMLHETDVNPIFVAFEKLDERTRSEIETDFRMVNDLACEDGVLQILEQAALCEQPLAATLHDMRNAYERACWTFLHEPILFRTAGRFHDLNRAGGWRRRFVGKRLESRTDEQALRSLGSQLRLFYRRQGRGRHCHVDHYLRLEPARHCFFAYPEDHASTDLGYDDHGRFQQRPRRSAFEVIFVYRPEEGVLEVRARGSARDVAQIERIFCMTILSMVELPDDSGRVPYDLCALRDGRLELALEPSDRVADVELRLLRFDLPTDPKSGCSRRVTCSVASHKPAKDTLPRLLDEVLATGVRRNDLLVSQARLRFTFRPLNGERPKTLTFDVAYPDRCTLKDDPHDQIARKCLRAWGIARD